jgi:ribonuclease P protein component
MKFSRRSRLLNPVQFRLVFKDPIRSDDSYFKVLARNNGKDQHRLGMAVSRKVCARAVDRNRIKRVIRESFRNRVGGKAGAGTLDFVVLPKHRAVGENNSMLDNSLINHWQRLISKADSLQARTQT